MDSERGRKKKSAFSVFVCLCVVSGVCVCECILMLCAQLCLCSLACGYSPVGATVALVVIANIVVYLWHRENQALG